MVGHRARAGARAIGVLVLVFMLPAVARGQAPEAAGPPEAGVRRIYTGEELRVRFPIGPVPGQPAYLSFMARIEAGRFRSGSAPACVITVNGVPTSLERLRNKAPYYFYTREERVFWFEPSSMAWVFSYYPWEDTSKAGGHANRFVLDVTDLLKPKDNEVVFKSIYSYGANDKPLEFRDIRLLIDEEFEKSSDLTREDPPYESHGLDRFRAKARGPHAGAHVRLNRAEHFRREASDVSPTTSYRGEFEFAMSPTGGIVLKAGSRSYAVYCSIRLAGEAWRDIGWPGSTETWDGLRVCPDGFDASTSRVSWQRRIIRRESHLEIRDTFANLTSEDQAVSFVNMIDVGPTGDILEFRLAGQTQEMFYACTSPLQDRLTGATPVAFVGLKGAGVGMVIEDDAYRNQATWMTWDSVLAAGDDMFYLGPHSSYTVVWKIYPLERPDYFDLVNAIRHDWGLFQEIPALFGFVHPGFEEEMYEDVRYRDSPTRLAEFMRSSGIGVAAATARYRGTADPPGSSASLYGGEPLDVFRKGLQPFAMWRDSVRSAGAEFKALPYMNVHLVRLVDGETLESVEERMPGALARNAWGEPVAYRPGWLYCIVPVPGSAVAQHMFEVMRVCLDEFGFDGIYLDEWDHSRARVSFGHSDGVSALLDADGRIVRKIGFVPILVKDFHVAFASELARRKAVIFANQFDDTLDAARLPIVHFAEPVSYDSFLISAAQVSRSPLSLQLKPRVNIFENVRRFLEHGVLTCYYWYYLHGDHVLKRCYPITVREIRPGIVIGDDRMVTSVSGKFTFKRNRPLRAYVYGPPDGVLKRTVEGASDVSTGSVAVTLELSDEEVAVILEE